MRPQQAVKHYMKVGITSGLNLAQFGIDALPRTDDLLGGKPCSVKVIRPIQKLNQPLSNVTLVFDFPSKEDSQHQLENKP